MIRDTAKEVMNAIHDTSKDDAPVRTMKKMEGFGGGGGGGGPVDEFATPPPAVAVAAPSEPAARATSMLAAPRGSSGNL